MGLRGTGGAIHAFLETDCDPAGGHRQDEGPAHEK